MYRVISKVVNNVTAEVSEQRTQGASSTHEQYAMETNECKYMHLYQQMVVGAVVACLYADYGLALW